MGHYMQKGRFLVRNQKLETEAREYDRESEMIEVSVGLFIASMMLEEGNERMYLEHLRRAQAHLTSLILDAEMHSPSD